MKKALKRVAAIAAVGALLTTSVVGCGQSKDAENSQASNSQVAVSTESAASQTGKEPVTITWFGGVVSSNDITTGVQDDVIMNAIKEKTGVTIDFTPQIGASDLNEKAGILLASNDLPDVMTFGDTALRTKVVKSGQALALDELVKTNGQNLEKYCSYALKVSKLLKSDETHALYLIPGEVNRKDLEGNTASLNYNIRWDLYKKLGQPKISSHDDLLKVLADMVKLEPTNKDGKKNYGFGMFLAESWSNLMVDKAFASERGMVNLGPTNIYLDMANDKIVPRITDPESVWWQSVKFYNKAFQMGLLDPESATLKFGNFGDKAKTGRYMLGECNWMLGGADQQWVTDGTPEKGYAPILVSPSADNVYFGVDYKAGSQFNTFISKNCKTPDRAMDVIDYLASPEGAKVMFNGPEGTYYKMQDGKPVLSEEIIKTVTSDADARKKTGISKYGNMQILSGNDPDSGMPLNFFTLPEVLQKTMTPAQKDYIATNSYNSVMDFTKNFKNCVAQTDILGAIMPQAGSDLEVKVNKAKAYFESNFAKVIFQKTDADFEKLKSKIIDDMKKMGSEEEVTYYNEQYQALKSQLK